MKTERNQKSQTTNYELFLIDDRFKQDSNLIAYITQAQNFYNSKQYPNDNYKNMIRVTMNICAFSAQIKAAKVCGTPVYLTFTADKQDVDCNALSQFDKYNCNKLHLDSHSYQAALNGFVNGTEVTFIRWDDDDTSYKGIYKGGLAMEHIDLRHFAVANPYIQDIQNQEWVMFWEDYPVGAIKKMLEGKDKDKKADLIEADVLVGRTDEKDPSEINYEQVTVYTRFFRIDGEVYFMCSTRTVDIFEFPHPLSRKVGKSIIKGVVEEYLKKVNEERKPEDSQVLDYQIDYEDLIMCASSSKSFTDKDYKEIKEKFSLYPFAVFRPYARNGSFYGRSDIDQMIPSQKAINYAYSMTLKCMENNAYSKIIVKPDALKGQVITNEPSQVLTDYSGFTNQWGIKFAESQPLPNGLLDAADKMFAMTRTVYNFTDVMDGSLTNQDMSGYMLSQMIKQSNTSIEQIQKLFWAYHEDMGEIRLMYYKHYVEQAKYTYEISDAEYEGQEQAKNMLNEKLNKGESIGILNDLPTDEVKDKLSKPVHKIKVGEIKNEDIYGIGFDVCIDAIQGVLDSQLVEQQFFDNLVLNGGMQNIDPDVFEMYLQAAPNISQRVKASLRTIVENRKHSRIAQLEQQLNELLIKDQQLVKGYKQLEEIVKQQKLYNDNLTSEFKEKINASNNMLGAYQNELAKLRQNQQPQINMNPSGVGEGELKSNNARGISGSQLGIE